jgi:hypothetical protein
LDSSWVGWLALGALLLFVVLLNLSLLTALRRKPGQRDDGWTRGLKQILRAPTAGRAARDQQAADLDELHQRVAALRQRDE